MTTQALRTNTQSDEPNTLQNSGRDVIVDIEHVVVKDDPRNWSKARKTFVLCIISGAAMIAGLAVSMFNPALAQMQAQFHTTSGEISWSISLFIIFQGSFPLIWSAVSEIYGRKLVYLVSFAITTIGCVVAATSKSIGLLIGIRCLQAVGTSAVLTLGAATLADIYDPHERGTIMGIYYCAPLLGPSLGPIIGGVLTQAFNWRATFWFMAAWTGLCFITFLFFKDTYRRERSLTYQMVSKRLRDRASANSLRASQTSTLVNGVPDVTPDKARTPSPDTENSSSGVNSIQQVELGESKENVTAQVVKQDAVVIQIPEVKVTLKDVNPIQPMIFVLGRLNNAATLFGSGFFFAFSYSISYTCARTLSDQYGYNALQVGLVLLPFGVGNLLGSVLGGRWSDHVQEKLKEKNDDVRYPEMRLASTKVMMCVLPPAVVAYAWVCDKHVHVAAICVSLFVAGFSSIWIYSSTLAYIVDANVGRSSSAVACNSCFRGMFGFAAAEIAVPLQDSIRDGGLYTLWAGFMVFSEVILLLVLWKGRSWRQKAEAKESGRLNEIS